jgi:hypothetical protein
MTDKIKLPASVAQAINEQQMQLFRAQGIVQCVKHALDQHFGDWPIDVPQFNMALEAADLMLDNIARDLFDSTIEDAAQKIEGKWAQEKVAEADNNG